MQNVDDCMDTVECTSLTSMQLPHPLDAHTTENRHLIHQNFQTTMAYTWIPNVCWLVLLLFPHNNCHRPPIPSKHHNTNSAPEDLPSNLAKRNTDCTQGQKYPE